MFSPQLTLHSAHWLGMPAWKIVMLMSEMLIWRDRGDLEIIDRFGHGCVLLLTELH